MKVKLGLAMGSTVGSARVKGKAGLTKWGLCVEVEGGTAATSDSSTLGQSCPINNRQAASAHSHTHTHRYDCSSADINPIGGISKQVRCAP